MKNKICALFIFACTAVLIGLVVLLAVNAVPISTLWMRYSLLGCLLVISLCLNIRFRKYTDLDETLSCAKRARQNLAKLKLHKEISYVKRLTVFNQLTNTELLLEEIIAAREIYSLKDNLAELKEIKSAIKGDENSKLNVKPETVATATKILDGILAELREL